MKKSIFDQGQPKGDMMLAALRQAVANLKAANDSSALTDKNAAAKQTVQTPVNPLKLNQVERKLDAADRVLFKNENQYNANGVTTGITPRMSEVQKDEEGVRTRYRAAIVQAQKATPKMSEVQKDEEGVRSRYSRPKYYVPTISELQQDEQGIREKLIQAEKGRDDNLWQALFGEQYDEDANADDTLVNTGTPVQFTGISLEEQRRRYDAAMKRAAQAVDDFYGYLDYSEIDIFDLTEEQKEIVELVKKELTKQAVLGTLTREEKGRIIRETTYYIYSNTVSAKGDSYPIIMELKDPNHYTKQMIPALGLAASNVLGESDLRLVLQDDNVAYKEKVYAEAIDAYNAALRDGDVKIGDFQEFYDQAVLKFYNNCIKPVVIETKVDGRKIKEAIPIGDLVPPEDDSFGAQLVREAMQLVGLGYNKPAGQGNESGIKIDCQGLVRWAIAQINPEWGKYGIGKGARYQIDDSDVVVWDIDDGTSYKDAKLEIGDTLFWEGDESGEIKHTAIYLGKINDVDYMIEAGDTVKIVPLREHTKNNNGEDSTLCQINQMTPERLQKNAEDYLFKQND